MAEVELHELSEQDLLQWQAALASTLKASTKHRLINDVKAALNAAYLANRQKLPSDLPAIIKHGLRVTANGSDQAPVARDNQILSGSDVSSLIAAARRVDERIEWDGDLFRLIVLLAATGARFSQVVRIRVGDVQSGTRRVIVPASRKGQGAKSSGIPFPVGTDVLEALLPAIENRPAHALLLERWRRRQVPGGTLPYGNPPS